MLYILREFVMNALCFRRWFRLTLSKGLQHVPSHPCQAVLWCVSWGGPSRGGAYRHGHGAARTVAGGRMRGASGLGLQDKNTHDSYSIIGKLFNLQNLTFTVFPDI